MTRDLYLLTTDLETQRVVAHALGLDSAAFRQRMLHSVAELTSCLEKHTVPLVLIDIDPEPLVALGNIEPLVQRFTETRFVVLCSTLSNEVMIEAMQVGVRNCLVKAKLERDLPPVVKRLARDRAGENSGIVVSVLSARGGCGSTTVALNLASELHQPEGPPVLLVDMDLDYGAAAPYLSLEPEFGLQHVLAQGANIDSQLISSTAATFEEGFQVLASPATAGPVDPQSIALGAVDTMLSACKSHYGHTVIDAPRMPMDSAVRLARASAITIVVLELAVVDVRRARSLFNELAARAVPRDSMIALVNCYKKRGSMLTLADAEEALNGVSIATVREDFESTMKAINLGSPLSKIAPRSNARKDIRDLLQSIHSRLESAA